MSNDTIRTIFTYTTALVVIVGGGVLIVVPTQLEPNTLLPFLTGAIGTVLGFVFGERTAASAVANQPTVVTSAGPPPSVTVTPPDDDGDDREYAGSGEYVGPARGSAP
jgi:hypothetical protein